MGRGRGASARVTVTANGAITRTRSRPCQPHASVVAVRPRGGSRARTAVTLSGANLADSRELSCRSARARRRRDVCAPGRAVCARAATQQPPVEQRVSVSAANVTDEIQLVELWALHDGAGEPPVSGNFTLELGTERTAPISANATVAEMAIKVGNLTSAGPVLVSRKDRTVEHHLSARTWRVRAWTVTFHARSGCGDVPPMVADASGLADTSPGDRVAVATLQDAALGAASASSCAHRTTLRPEVQSSTPRVARRRRLVATTAGGDFDDRMFGDGHRDARSERDASARTCAAPGPRPAREGNTRASGYGR